MGTEKRIVVQVDVSGLDEPDAGTVDVLAHMQLVARRHGATLLFQRPCPALVGLIRLSGLAEVLPVEPDGPAEAGEPPGIEEDGEGPNPPR